MNKLNETNNKFSEYFIKSSKNCNALDVACGNGLKSIYLANNGWNVTAIDINKSLEKKFDSHKKINFFNINLEKKIKNYISKPPFNKKFNLVIVFRYLYRPLLSFLPKLLKKEGILIYETFMEGNEKYGRPNNKNYLLKKNELKSIAKEDLKILDFDQGLRVFNNKKSIIQYAVFKKLGSIKSH